MSEKLKQREKLKKEKLREKVRVCDGLWEHKCNCQFMPLRRLQYVLFVLLKASQTRFIGFIGSLELVANVD